MKLAILIVLLPLAVAFQPTSISSRHASSGRSMFKPDLNWDAATNHVDEPLSNLVPDCTKPPTVSTLNKGTYERLNGHHAPQYQVNPDISPKAARPSPPPTGDPRAFFPDPANTPSNPLSSTGRPTTGRAPDQRPEEWHRL